MAEPRRGRVVRCCRRRIMPSAISRAREPVEGSLQARRAAAGGISRLVVGIKHEKLSVRPESATPAVEQGTLQ
jgi:hypothetical protein